MSKGKSTTTTTTDPAQMAIYQDLYSKAQGIAQQPFVPYTGARVAGFNPDQLMGFDATRNMFNQSMGFNPRNQLNNLANMSAPSVNLPFGYSQPQQPSPIFQPMPITGGGGRPTPPPSIGGIGGGGPVMPSPGQRVGTDLREAGFLNMPEAIFDGPRVSMEEAEASRRAAGGGRRPTPVDEGVSFIGGSPTFYERIRSGEFGDIKADSIEKTTAPMVDNRASRPRGLPIGGNVPGGGGISFRKPGVTVRRPDPIRSIRPGLLNPPQSQTNPFSPTQLGPAAMQQAATVRPIERFGGANVGELASFGGANIDPVERFGGANIDPVERFGAANISPVDLYSGASINRGDVRDVRPQSLLSTDLGAYQNPFQSQVIDNTLDDLNRARQLQIQSDQDAAIGRGAFGGSRSALLESETNRNFAEQAARTAGDLRAKGFDTATSLASQDIGRQFDADRFMSDADRAIATQNASFGQQAGLARQGLLGDVSLNQARLDQQAGLAGMDAANRRALQQGQFQQQAGMAGMDAANRRALQQGQFQQQAGMADMDAFNRAAMQNAQFRQQAGIAGADAYNRAGSQQAQLDASRFAANQDALNRFGLQQGQFNNQMNMGMFDAANKAAFMQPELEMRNRQFQAGLLGDQLSDQYRSLGMLSGIGSQQQGLQQRGMDAGYNEFLRALNYGPQQLGLLAQGVSALPGDSASTNQYKPGTMEQIGNAAGTIGTIMGLFSDERLKDNITLVGKSKGHNVYTWTWNDVAKKLGINTPEIGVIAQEVAHIPNAVFKHESGYLTVNYGAL